MRFTRMKQVLRPIVLYVTITAMTLALLDVMLIALGVFPPPTNPGEPDLGWVASEPTGEQVAHRCREFESREVFWIERNEAGMRTALSVQELTDFSDGLRIAVTGDSQTDLCAPNEETHAGYLESHLAAGGVANTVYQYGAGRYSPLQGYLAYEKHMARFDPDIFVLNLYSGNDLNDLMRIDDRPHYVGADGAHAVAPPIWYRWDPPGVERRSRVLYLMSTALKRTGARNFLLRLSFLRQMASDQRQGLGAVILYLNDLRKSVEPTLGYPEAFSAQMLNQQLFFRRFPKSRDESLARLETLLRTVRAENPDMILVLTGLPSYLLTGQYPDDPALNATLERLEIGRAEGREQERSLYYAAGELAKTHGWLFVDALTPLAAYAGDEKLYNEFDYHLLPVASEIVGRAQAEAVLAHLAREPTGAGAGSRPRDLRPCHLPAPAAGSDLTQAEGPCGPSLPVSSQEIETTGPAR